MLDVIPADAAVTLDGLFAERVRRTPERVAYRYFDAASQSWRDLTWAETARRVGGWQAALAREGLAAGERVALMLRNCPEWVIFDQAALGLGLVTVPLYTSDRPDNVAYIVEDCGARVLLVEGGEQWRTLSAASAAMPSLKRIVSLAPVDDSPSDPRLVSAGAWAESEGELLQGGRDPDALASIIYTSGTTGRPKGVMLSHRNMLTNAQGCLRAMDVLCEDLFLSFLPLSHTFERTVGYYLTLMSGSTTAYARSVQQLAEDLQTVRPTILISVPRIYERVYGAIRQKLVEGPPANRRLFELAVDVGWGRFEHFQGRAPWRPAHLLWPLLKPLVADKVLARLGGRLKAALAGGAPLPPDVARMFIGLGLPVLQGYGLTETSPVVSCNRPDDNLPASVGKPIEDVSVRLGERDALLVKGPNVMLGYWNNPEATRAVLSEDGWLDTGDTARFDDAGRIYITGRLKEIIVLSNGEKVSPSDMEAAIVKDPLFEQVLVLGEGRPFLSVLTVLNPDEWRKLAAEAGLDPAVPGADAETLALDRIAQRIHEFPGYARVRRVTLSLTPWSVENGLLTPTLKLKRARVVDRFHAEIDRMYAGH